MTAKKTHRNDAPPATEDPTVENAATVDAERAAEDMVDHAESVSAEAGIERAEGLSAEEAAALNARLEQAELKVSEYLDDLQRERATFQNYKRRVERERAEQAQAVAGTVLLKLLPTLDDFYRAMDAVPGDQRDQWFEGVGMILRKFERFLKDEGVSEIDALGQPFNPALHEAIGVDVGSDAESGTITLVMQRGYRQGERVLRPAMVRVAE